MRFFRGAISFGREDVRALFSLNTQSNRQPIYRFKPFGKGSESKAFDCRCDGIVLLISLQQRYWREKLVLWLHSNLIFVRAAVDDIIG